MKCLVMLILPAAIDISALINFSLQFCLMQHGRCQLLNGFIGRIKVGNSFLAHQRFGFAYFILAVLKRCVFAVRLTFVTYLVQPYRIGGKAKQLGA